MNEPDPGFCSLCGRRREIVIEKTCVHSEGTGKPLYAIYVKCPKAFSFPRFIAHEFNFHNYDYIDGLDGCFLHSEQWLLEKGYPVKATY